MKIYEVQYTAKFKRDYRNMVKSGHDMEHLKKIVRMLAGSEPLPPKNRDHALTGNWNGYRECHIEPDWLLVYKYFDDKLILSLTRTGSHSYLDMD